MATNTLGARGNLFDVVKLRAPNAKGIRTSSLPSGSLVNVGEYWAASKGERTPFVEALATMKDSWECPTDVLKTEGKEISQALVREERKDHIEGNGQAWCNLILQGPSTPTQNAIVGLMGRAPWNAVDSEFCWDVGGTGTDLRSAWLICPGPTRVHLIHNPNHPTAGIEFEDKGESREVDPNDSTKHRWILTHEYMIQQGLCIRDQRSVKRIANVQCAASDYSGADAINEAIKASLKHNINANKPWFLYCDADLYTQLVLATNDKLKVYTSDRNIYQTALPMIGPNIVIRRMDALNHASGSGETVVS
jgi:hypothetical protein